jgi:outer membrane protein assembly factor BamB
MLAHTFVRCFVFGLILFSSGLASAATFNGTVESVSADDKSVTVKLTGKQVDSKTFTLAATAVIVVDGKKATLDDVSEGQTAIVVANTANVATRLSLKSPKTPPASKKPGKRTGDKPEAASAEGSWPQFRGPNRDNISTETGLLDEWTSDGPKLAWEQKDLGEAYSTVAISDGKIFTMGNVGDNEMLLALDAATGKHLWSTKTGGRAFKDGTGNGPRGTPTVDGDRVYALGANGDLVCAGVDNGEVVWQKNILQEYGGSNITWGISESVLIDGKLVICSPGGRQATIAGIDKLTGRGVWRSSIQGAPQASYSSPILVEFGGERLIVNFVHTGVVGIRAKNGDPVWGYPASSNGTANCSTPLFDDGMIFTSSGYQTGCAMFKLATGGRAAIGYSNKEMKNHHGGMVVLDGHVYGFDEAIMKCVNLKTGNTVWQDRSVGKGSVTYADGHLYLRSENGPAALCVATTKSYEEKGRFDPKNRSGRPAWSHPVVCGGRLYLRDMDTLTVYDVKK